jgi:hypothetical protein
MPSAVARPPDHRGVEGEEGAGVLGLSLQGEHVGVAVDDPGGGGVQRGRAAQRGLHRARLGFRQQAQVGHAVGGGALADPLQPAGLLLRGRDDQLAAIVVRHAAVAAEIVEAALAVDAGARDQAAGGVVDAGMDDLAVAGRGLGADALGGVEHQHLAPGQRQGAGDGEPDHAGADHDRIELLHAKGSCSRGTEMRRTAARCN